jgi:hypothetical protein
VTNAGHCIQQLLVMDLLVSTVAYVVIFSIIAQDRCEKEEEEEEEEEYGLGHVLRNIMWQI